MTIGICADSSSQLPPELVERFGIAVVPMTVRVGECEYLEGVDLGPDEFYAHFVPGSCPDVSTSHPSPGQFALAYDDLVARGCTQILSIHLASGLSGTLNSVRLAAHSSPVPVRVVDSGTAGFALGCCVWAAAAAVESGASVDEAAAVVEALAPQIDTTFIVSAEDLGRLAPYAKEELVPSSRAQVLCLSERGVRPIGHVDDAAHAVRTLAAQVARATGPVRVGVGSSAPATLVLADALAAEVAALPNVSEVVRYRVGPSIGAHTGPGTIGCVTFPAAPGPSTPAAS